VPIAETTRREPASKRNGKVDEHVKGIDHAKWDCKYHVVFPPKCRCKVPYDEWCRHFAEVFLTLAQHKESRIVDGHLISDGVHMMIAKPPVYSVSNVAAPKSKTRPQIIRLRRITWPELSMDLARRPVAHHNSCVNAATVSHIVTC
jgi:putative transposase